MEGLHLVLNIALFLALIASSTTQNLQFRVNLRRRDDQFSFAERLRTAVERSRIRAQNIAASVNHVSPSAQDIETPVHVGTGGDAFLMDFSVGTPPIKVEALLDTGSDLIWTQCQPCTACLNQPTPIFDPNKSSTYSRVPCADPLCKALGIFRSYCPEECRYDYRYGGSGRSLGDFGRDVFTFGKGTATPISFGCGHITQNIPKNTSGIVGLGRGKLSLISQLGDQVNNKFSYCLLPVTEPPSKTSPMFFGAAAEFPGGFSMISPTSFGLDPSYWYVPMTGITVAGKSVVPPNVFPVDRRGNNGVIIDSGTIATLLVPEAYNPVLKAVKAAVKETPVNASDLFEVCYKAPSGTKGLGLPSMSFNFEGGMVMELPVENYFIPVDGEHVCLAIQQWPNAPSILGSIQQQNFQFLYDRAKLTVTFRPLRCDTL